MRSYQQTVFLLLFALLISVAQAENTVENISPQQLVELQKQGAVVIDVRTPGEWEKSGIIPGAHKAMFFDEDRNQIEDQFAKQINGLIASDKPVVVYCHSGYRSGLASQFLAKKQGVSKVYNLDGGIKRWLDEGKATDKECC